MEQSLPGLELTAGAAGADEVGRGALAGPVVCAAVVLPEGFDAAGLNDSKKLTDAQRRTQAARIRASGADCAVVFVEAAEVDELNVLQASLAGMQRAAGKLSTGPKRLLVDGRDCLFVPGMAVEAHIKGDARFAAIAAASILAKVARDDHMIEMASLHPGYGFESNVGYAAPVHLAALKRIGPCPIHRRTFEPVRSLLLQPCLMLDE